MPFSPGGARPFGPVLPQHLKLLWGQGGPPFVIGLGNVHRTILSDAGEYAE